MTKFPQVLLFLCVGEVPSFEEYRVQLVRIFNRWKLFEALIPSTKAIINYFNCLYCRGDDFGVWYYFCFFVLLGFNSLVKSQQNDFRRSSAWH